MVVVLAAGPLRAGFNSGKYRARRQRRYDPRGIHEGWRQMEWTIQDLGAAGELVGAIGVVITLVYLAYQIRQNTVQLEQNTLTARAAAQNASNTALRETRVSLFESAEMAQIFATGNSNPADLDEIDRLRYRLAIQNVTDVMHEIYAQTLETGFAPETWRTQGHTLVQRILATPGGEWFWRAFGDNYPANFRAEVDRILEETHRGQGSSVSSQVVPSSATTRSSSATNFGS